MDRCKVCGGPTVVTHRNVVLKRYEVAYHRCLKCEYWCTDEPFWLDEAYSSAVAATDTGIIQRNLSIARQLRVILTRLFPNGPYVDWAGGYGILVRLMRDAGFEFFWQDRFAENLFARGFAWESQRGRAAKVVTAVEAVEHAPDPMTFFEEALTGTGAESVIFTQQLHTGHYDSNWWYLSPVTGQHVSFFSIVTLHVIAQRLGMFLRSWGTLHVLTLHPIDSRAFRRATRVIRLVEILAAGPDRLSPSPTTLTWADHQDLTARLP